LGNSVRKQPFSWPIPSCSTFEIGTRDPVRVLGTVSVSLQAVLGQNYDETASAGLVGAIGLQQLKESEEKAPQPISLVELHNWSELVSKLQLEPATCIRQLISAVSRALSSQPPLFRCKQRESIGHQPREPATCLGPLATVCRATAEAPVRPSRVPVSRLTAPMHAATVSAASCVLTKESCLRLLRLVEMRNGMPVSQLFRLGTCWVSRSGKDI
jgi:hypothetical protein